MCEDCRGIWVAGDQFRALAAKVAADGQVPADGKITFHPRKVILPHADSIKARQCPECYEPMREFNYAYDSNIFLDRCDICGGIWLNPNEIIDIAKHIQYNPDVVAAGKSLLDIRNNREMEEELGRCEKFMQIACILLRLIIFRF